MDLSRPIGNVLVCSIIPYFLERENFWFIQNLKKILEARKTQTFFEGNTLFLERGQIFNFSEFLRRLDEMGYEKVWQVSEIGEFSQRGGIIDVFPINFNFAIRIEFFGNKIEEILKLPVEIKDEKKEKEILKKKLKSQRIFSDLKGIKEGDYLVHLDHGVGVYNGQRTISSQQYYEILYTQGDRLYVPSGLERKLSRYIGFSAPKVSRLGTLTWQRTKRKVKEEVEKMARELLEIYAKREIAKRKFYLLKSEIDLILKNTFPFEETPDQFEAMRDVENDLEKNEKPMDRIICGDVGFGKTEIALRAMIKAIDSGLQTAMICPTTILANQHYQNFKKRLKNLPIEIAMISRLQSKREQEKIIEKLKEGKIDILVGTHRVLSKDVMFKNLGLLVIDDEHRFGVEQKEKLKKLKTSIDILSLSATPIPRTLYMTLSSLRNISLIQTPPEGRLPVKTFIGKFSKEKIREAIENEIRRGGQIYFLHNRIETLKRVKDFLEKLIPNAKIEVAHGRLKEKELVRVMENFQSKKIDVLLATTIIEAGLDFPNVNTLIVDDATKLGLSEAYQIRGRIGRSFLQAFAYFFYPSRLTGKARLRLKALKEAEELGSGYKIALKDLEIRGAGNILGKEQSGNINAVGLNLYCQILSEAVEKFKKSLKT